MAEEYAEWDSYSGKIWKVICKKAVQLTTPTVANKKFDMGPYKTEVGTVTSVPLVATKSDMVALANGIDYTQFADDKRYGLSPSWPGSKVIFAPSNIIVEVIVWRRAVSPIGEVLEGWNIRFHGYVDCSEGAEIINAEGFVGGNYYDVDIRIYPYSTIAECIAGNVCTGLGYGPPPKYTLTFSSDPARGISIFIDGAFKGKTPMSYEVSEGLHTIGTTEFEDIGVEKYYFYSWAVYGSVQEFTEDIKSARGFTVYFRRCVPGKWEDVRCTDIIIGKKEQKRVWEPEKCYPPTGIEYREVDAPECIKPAECIDEQEKCVGYDYYLCKGGLWSLPEKNSPKCGWVCSPTLPEACVTKEDCERIGLYWYDGRCHEEPKPPEKPWYAWFTEQTIVPGVPNWVFVAVPVGAGVGITLAVLAARRKK